MLMIHSVVELKAKAQSRHREEALSVILPRLLGAITYDGEADNRIRSFPKTRVVERGRFKIEAHDAPAGRFFCLRWDRGKMLSGYFFPKGEQEGRAYLEGNVEV